jgi:hypothetical protein
MSEILTEPVSRPLSNADWLKYVGEQVGKLRYGAVEIIVHDSRVTQIELTERVRLERAPTEPLSNSGE